MIISEKTQSHREVKSLHNITQSLPTSMLGRTCENISSFLSCVQPMVALSICHIHSFKRSRHQREHSFVAWSFPWKEKSFHSYCVHKCKQTHLICADWTKTLSPELYSTTVPWTSSHPAISSHRHCYLFFHFYLDFTFGIILTLLSLRFGCNSDSVYRETGSRSLKNPHLLVWPTLELYAGPGLWEQPS